MSYRRQVSRALDEEHRTSLDLLGRVEQVFARSSRAGSTADSDLARVAGDLGRHLEQDIGRHFDFEEHELFPRITDAGDGDMAALLIEEHDAIRGVVDELLPLTRAAAAGTLDEPGWLAFKRTALELVERLVAHIAKETMALLPLLDDLLDEDADRDLALAYATG